MEARTGVEPVYTALQAVLALTNQRVSSAPHFAPHQVAPPCASIALRSGMPWRKALKIIVPSTFSAVIRICTMSQNHPCVRHQADRRRLLCSHWPCVIRKAVQRQALWPRVKRTSPSSIDCPCVAGPFLHVYVSRRRGLCQSATACRYRPHTCQGRSPEGRDRCDDPMRAYRCPI
jgi:hypothetical protein